MGRAIDAPAGCAPGVAPAVDPLGFVLPGSLVVGRGFTPLGVVRVPGLLAVGRGLTPLVVVRVPPGLVLAPPWLAPLVVGPRLAPPALEPPVVGPWLAPPALGARLAGGGP